MSFLISPIRAPSKATPNSPPNTAGKTWRFSSSANRDAFAADPARYAPHYGGHCAYGVAQGYLVFGDPKAWSVHDGVLYFNYNIPTRDRWLSRRGQYIAESERAWPKLAR